MLALTLSAILAVKLWLAFQYRFLIWDSYVYLSDARVFLSGPAPNLYFEIGRPPLLPYLVALA